MRAYVLGLPDGFRGAALLERLRELGFDACMVAGIDGRAMPGHELELLHDPKVTRVTVGRELSAGEIACSLGHRRMYEQLVTDGDPWALLFEDDASIEAGVLDVLAALPSLPDRSIVTLRHDEAGALVCNPFIAAPRTVRRLVAAPQGASAYFMNRSAAEHALTMTSTGVVDGAPDWPVAWATDMHWWVSEENLSPHSESPSLLQAGRDARFASFVPPWGDAGLIDRIRWMTRLHGVGFPWHTARRAALTHPLLSRVLRISLPKSTRPQRG